MKVASWILLTLVSALIALFSIGSLGVAYLAPPSNDAITPTVTLDSLQLDPGVATALRARRGTAATLGLAWATLLLCIILGPYRKGAVWAWWAILVSVSVFALGGVLRWPLLGTQQGAWTGVFLLVAVLIGLLLDARRLTS